MATVDENGQLDPVGTPVVEERLDRGPDRAARVEDVVDEHDRLSFERKVQGGGADNRLGVPGRVRGAHPTAVPAEAGVEGGGSGGGGGAGGGGAVGAVGGGGRGAFGSRRARRG